MYHLVVVSHIHHNWYVIFRHQLHGTIFYAISYRRRGWGGRRENYASLYRLRSIFYATVGLGGYFMLAYGRQGGIPYAS